MQVTCPAKVTSIIPAHMHMHLQLSSKAGMFFTNTVGSPGTQGATVLGMQGMGVNTPEAAVVAEATVGFAKDWHIPKVAIFTIGL